MNWKIKHFKHLTGEIRVLTGLHIGGGQDVMEIGGKDNPVIRNPVNNEPYIPGSSLKGKMRSMMEWHLGRLDTNGDVHSCRGESEALQCPICRVFGTSAERDKKIGMTRLLVRDGSLTESSRQDLRDGKPITEDKSENSINRITAMANPRPMERVVPSVTFNLDIVFRVLDMGDDGAADEKLFQDVLLTGLALVQQDFLGGGGSRGNGRIEFTKLKDESGRDITLPQVLEATGS